MPSVDTPQPSERPTERSELNTLQPADEPVHGWYRFVLSFPPHLVRRYLDFVGVNGKSSVVLDPFCGTGTTLVEAKKQGIKSVGCDAHPFAVLASRVKTRWDLSVPEVKRCLSAIVASADCISAARRDRRNGGLTEAELKLIPTGFLSPKPLRRLLALRESIDEAVAQSDPDPGVKDFFLLAFAHVIANGAGNFAFGPEIYRTKAKGDYDVLAHFVRQSDRMIQELGALQHGEAAAPGAIVERDDARTLEHLSARIDAVITSPPYPNEKDYTRTTRVETILLRLVTDRPSLREMKESLLRSNTRNVFIKDDDGDEVKAFASIRAVCDAIEKRRIELEKTSGFERLYHKVVAHYFGGMRRHFRALRPKLKPGAHLAYVVGDQLSFLMVPVRTAQLLGEVAESEGFKVVGCDLWRERVGTKIRNDAAGRRTVRVREEVLLLRPA